MAGDNWKEKVFQRCLYLIGKLTEESDPQTIVQKAEGAIAQIRCPDPADTMGGERYLVLFGDVSYVKSYLEMGVIIVNEDELRVEACTNYCDIPDSWSSYIEKVDLSYPPEPASVPSNPQGYTPYSMPGIPGHQQYRFPFFMPPAFPMGARMPQPEGATGKEKSSEGQMHLHGDGGQYPFYPMWPQWPPGAPPYNSELGQQQQMFGPQGFMLGSDPGNLRLPMPMPTLPPPYTESNVDTRDEEPERAQENLPDVIQKVEETQDSQEQDQADNQEESSKQENAMIKVTNIPPDASQDSLMFFFENRRKTGGGPVEEVEYDADTQSAVITFEDPEAVDRVLAKLPILFNGKKIDVEKFQPEQQSEEKNGDDELDTDCTIEVTGVKAETSPDTVEMYFENTRRSAGGEVVKLEQKDGFYFITFESAEVMQAVLKRKHKIDGADINVKKYIPPPPPKPVPMYTNKAFIKSISSKTTKDGLENFLEAKTGITPSHIEYGEEEGTALVTFEEDLDFEKLQLACQKRSLDKSHLIVSKVPITNCVIIRNISPNTSQDTLEFYFDNKRRSGVSDVLDVKLFGDFCLVYFEDPESADVVCERTHKIDGQVLDVKIYYECIGQVSSQEEGPFKPPAPVEMTDIDVKKLQFLVKSKINKEAVEKQLDDLYAKPVWPKSSDLKSKGSHLKIECMLTAETTDCWKLSRNWQSKVKDSLKQYMDNLISIKHTTLQEAWPLVFDGLKSVTIKHPEAIAVILEKKDCEIYVVGLKNAVNEVSKHINDIIDKVGEDLDKKHKQVQEEKTLKRHQVLILQFSKFEAHLGEKYKDITVKYDINKNCVIFEGLQGEVTPAIVEMYERLTKVAKAEEKSFSPLLQKFLQGKEVIKYVNSKMREKKVIGVWEIVDSVIWVYSLSEPDVVTAAHVLKDSVIETPVDVEQQSVPLLMSEPWLHRVKEIEDENPGLIKIVTQANQLKVIILCTDKFEGTTREYVVDFIGSNTIYDENLSLEPGIMRFLQDQFEKELSHVKEGLQEEQGDLSINNTGIAIKATKTGLNKAKMDIDRLIQSIKKKIHPIHKPGIRKHIESNQGREKISGIERSEGVVIHVTDESEQSDEDTEGAGFSSGQSQRRELAVCVTKSGIKISATVVDMTELDVDVIVNPANKDLRHIGGLAKIIVEKGGKEIQNECSDHVRRHQRLLEGQIFMSGAGNLRCKKIVHAVGPVWQSGKSQENELLREAVFKSLEGTSGEGWNSIAFPALCTGVFGYPIKEATRVIVLAVKDYFRESQSSNVDMVYLCDVKEETVEGFVDAMKKNLENVTVKSSGSGNGSKWKSSTGPVPAPRPQKSPAISAGGITIKVIKGSIVRQQVDVIVNTTSRDLKLSNGAVSNSLLSAGGPILQQECDTNYPNGIQHGDIAVTSGGNLSCQCVCHGSLPGWDQQGQALKILKAFLKKCLDHVENNSWSSVAFPALGTGNLGYPRDVVAREMFGAVGMYSQKASTSIKEVRFILYDKDTLTVKAFEHEEKKQGGGGRHGRQFGANQGFQSSRSSGGGNSSSSNSSHSSSGTDDLSDSEQFVVDIGNIQFKVYQGDIIKADVDVMVNSTNTEFDLSRGIVSKILLQLGGKELKKQIPLHKTELQKTGLAVTTTGNKSGMTSQFILHLDGENQDLDWTEKITLALQKVDSIYQRSIAFPTLGQAFGVKIENLAKYFFDAIVDVQENVNTLKEVHVVIYESKMINGFLNSFKHACETFKPKKGGFLKKLSNWFSGKSSPHFSFSSAHKTLMMPANMSSVTFLIYAKSHDVIDKVTEKMESFIDEAFQHKTFNDSVIKHFSPQQEDIIKDLKNKFDVDINIEKRIGRIHVKGLPEDVMNATDKVHQVIREVDKARQEKQAAEMMASMVTWCFLDITMSGQKLEEYPDHINLLLEKGLRNQESKVSFHDAQGQKYIVDLATYEEYPANDPTDKVKVIRKNKIDASAFDQPSTWSTMDAKENVAVVTVLPQMQEYQDVLKEFQTGVGTSFNIIKIERIQNRMLLQQYDAKLKLMEKQNPPNTQNEKMLWHGTANDAVASINTYGFNRSYCGKNATAYGNGVYFAVNANYSANDVYSPRDVSNNKRMYRCRVLTGEYCKGSHGMKVPPNKPGSQGHILYDSVVDNPSRPGIFVIYNDTQAYPEYLITFQ